MTPQERKVMELALEALYALAAMNYTTQQMKNNAISDIKEALAQPEQEPVAWGLPGSDGFIFDVISPEEHTREEGGYTVPLYTTPPQPKEPDPVEIWRDDAPPKRGAYKVKRVGEASTQRGYSYWDGEMWGMIFSRRSLAQEYKTSARKRKSQYAMQWLQKAAHGIKE